MICGPYKALHLVLGAYSTPLEVMGKITLVVYAWADFWMDTYSWL